MSDSLAANRSRRGESGKTKSRNAALERLKAAKKGEWSYTVVEGGVENVYDLVDENEYAEKVHDRVSSNFIVDDVGSGYVEDGREIFDEDEENEESLKRKRKGPRSSDSAMKKSKRCNIKNMLLGMGTKKGTRKKGEIECVVDADETTPSIEHDDVLDSILQDMKRGEKREDISQLHSQFTSHDNTREQLLSDGGKGGNPFAKNSAMANETGKILHSNSHCVPSDNKNTCGSKVVSETNEGALVGVELDDINFEDSSDGFTTKVNEEEEREITNNVRREEEEDSLNVSLDSTADTAHTKSTDIAKETFTSVKSNQIVPKIGDTLINVSNDDGQILDCSMKIPTQNQSADSSEKRKMEEEIDVDKLFERDVFDKEAIHKRRIRMYWIDAYEDHFKRNGTIYLFGKIRVGDQKSSKVNFLSCCFTVKNIPRQIFLRKRAKFRGGENFLGKKDGDEVTLQDVYNEFAQQIAPRYNIKEFRSKAALNKQSVFGEKCNNEESNDLFSQYIEVQYSAEDQPISHITHGDTFSSILGADKSFLEHFLITQKIMGPSWLEFEGDLNSLKVNLPPISWCSVDLCIDYSIDCVKVLSQDEQCCVPPLTLISLSLHSTLNAKSKQSEITVISCLVNSNYKSSTNETSDQSQQDFTSYICGVSSTSSLVYPYDFGRLIKANNLNVQKSGFNVNKFEGERSLLAFFIARIGKIDPDIIIGHDLSQFDLDILLDRVRLNKIGNWSKLGKLKRSHFITSGSNQRRNAAVFAGRMICDLKISAKELLNRCKNYELKTLVEKLLPESYAQNMVGKGALDGGELVIDSERIKKAFEISSSSILNLLNFIMKRNFLVLKCTMELNVIPLAQQITSICGNVMSNTLSGGRAERNEFLLLHAFYDRNYLCPDKTYGRSNHDKNKNLQNTTKNVANRSMVVKEEETSTAASIAINEMNVSKAINKRSGGKSGGGAAYEGGLVLEPRKGFYDKYILLMDFNSLYPSIIQEYNICFTTIECNNTEIAAPLTSSNESGNATLLPYLPSDDTPQGVLPAEIRKLVESRKAVKNLIKGMNKNGVDGSGELQQLDVRQKALKLTANSMYGCLGFSNSRFYAKHLASLITSQGREILMHTKSVVENKMNLEVIYGDTDSLMINTNTLDYEEALKLGFAIKSQVNKLYKLLELDVDGVYRYMLLLKKKKYAALSVERNTSTGELTYSQELKGLDIVRRDWSTISSKFGKRIIDNIMKVDDTSMITTLKSSSSSNMDDKLEFIHESLRQLASDFRDNKISVDDLIITKQLTKDPTEYGNDVKSLPHVQVALRWNKQGSSVKPLKSGDTVEFIICYERHKNSDGKLINNRTSIPHTQRAYHVNEVKRAIEEREKRNICVKKEKPNVTTENENVEGIFVDIEYYLSQQIHPVVSRLCEPIEGTDGGRIAQCLGLPNADSYNTHKSSSTHGHDLSVFPLQDKFSGCEPFKFKCGCDNELSISSQDLLQLVGTKSTTEGKIASLTHCTHCFSSPIQLNGAAIVNTLSNTIRCLVSKYYESVLICEDPACSGSTRQFPLEIVNGFPLCPLCKMAIMFKEFGEKQLYVQLLFFKQIVSVCNTKNTVFDEKLKRVVHKFMDSCGYSVVDMADLFQNVSFRQAASFRHGMPKG